MCSVYHTPGAQGWLGTLCMQLRMRLTLLTALQPSIEIFEVGAPSCLRHPAWCAGLANQRKPLPCAQAFDELVLLKRGGLLIYNGPTGAWTAGRPGARTAACTHLLHSGTPPHSGWAPKPETANALAGKESRDLVAYFERIQGVPSIEQGINPATWMLEVRQPSARQHPQSLGHSLPDRSHTSMLPARTQATDTPSTSTARRARRGARRLPQSSLAGLSHAGVQHGL